MKITFLGTGTSSGVPELGCRCEVCSSNDERDKRTRSSVLIETGGKNILIDCGPDFRSQMLNNGMSIIDAVLITHEHYDHVGGLDDLRPLSYTRDIPLYGEAEVLHAINKQMPYAFLDKRYPGLPHLNLQTITMEPFEIDGIHVIPIRVMHGELPILGFRIGKIAYLTDLKTIPEEEFEKLADVDLLIIEALRQDNRHYNHEGIEEALENIKKIKPKTTYLIHMSHHIGLHAVAEKTLPENVYYAYDGLTLER